MLDSRVIKGIATTRAPDFLNAQGKLPETLDIYQQTLTIAKHLASGLNSWTDWSDFHLHCATPLSNGI